MKTYEALDKFQQDIILNLRVQVVWEAGQMAEMPTLDQIRENVKESLRTLRQDHKRSLNPTPYKVSQQSCHSLLFYITQALFS